MNEHLLKILIVGDGNVGKSSFVHRYVNGQFNKTYKMTMGGQERFISMNRIYYKGALGCVVMFDVTSSASFLSCCHWKRDLDNKAMLPNGDSIPCILLANKCDLAQRVVFADSIDRFSKANGFVTWMEVSVKENKNIGEAMRFLLQCLEDLDANLRKLNSRLFVIRGQPANVFPRLFKEWKISRLTFEIIELNGGQPPLTYKRFQTLISRLDPPEMPVETLSDTMMGRCAWVANFERPRMNANSLLTSPTGLSPYLRFGCLSCRLFYFKLTELYRKVKKNSSPPLSLYGQLLWREFFYTTATNNPRFDKMEGNPICVRIPWDKNSEALAKWAEAKTGFPWIDAIMTQLRHEGWIHHLARHAVACFLTRGDLWISWEEGMKQFFHCYCPVGFGRRTDPNGDFIRRYLPVLRGFPAKFIYDPWNAPESVQLAAKCIIGVHYPKPMVHHAEASRLNIERMKQIYQQLSRYRGLVPSTNGNGNGGMMAYSPGEQQPGTNNNSHLPGVSGSCVATGNGSGSILIHFHNDELMEPGSRRPQLQGGASPHMSVISLHF
ncbi:Cryptochrome-1 [Liparis tanakae]|uniref:Cryptochrome-1 n=1 Tax=Liparis tanakae TaxID=230148 RepID=A0A4Z2IQJ2_9TELE|nr:Cryptochrome-1 [Liparis tanakae]